MLLPSLLSHVTLASTTPPLSLSYSQVQIWNFSLVDNWFTVNSINSDDLGSMDYETFKTPRWNGGGVLNRYYRWHSVNINITIITDSKEALQSKMDTLKKSISWLEDYLYVRTPNDQRKLKWTVTNVVFNRQHYHITFIQAQITFTTVSPFFEDLITQSQSRSVTGSFTEEFLHNGTAPTSPRIFCNFSTSDVTSISMLVNGSLITIVQAIQDNSILIIDSQAKTVTLNGLNIDFTGVFPELSAGSNEITMTISWACSMDYTMIAPKTYL